MLILILIPQNQQLKVTFIQKIKTEGYWIYNEHSKNLKNKQKNKILLTLIIKSYFFKELLFIIIFLFFFFNSST